jgi:phospholipid/cholesterol/gamma-HCH transport system substrate-binding protein
VKDVDSSRQGSQASRPSALFLLSGVMLAIALLVGLAREQNWGQSLFGLKIRTADADGLRPGMEVRIAGLPVGKVVALSLGSDARVAIELQIQERYRHLVGPRSRAYQGQDGFVGDHYIAITPDTASDLPVRRTPVDIPYEPSLNMRDLIKGLEQTRGTLQRTLDNTSVLTARDVPRTLADMRQSLGAVSRLSSRMQKEAESTAPEIRRTLRQVDRTAVTAGQTAITARETATSARRAADEASQTLGSSRPLLLRILRDVQGVTGSTERMLRSLLGSEALTTPTTQDDGKAPASSSPGSDGSGHEPSGP